MLQHLRNHIHWGEAGDVETSYKAVLLWPSVSGNQQSSQSM
jgi:hypothetical protein